MSAVVTPGAVSRRALRVRGDPEHPVTQGFLCRRTNRFLDRQYSPERVTTPLARKVPGPMLRT